MLAACYCPSRKNSVDVLHSRMWLVLHELFSSAAVLGKTDRKLGLTEFGDVNRDDIILLAPVQRGGRLAPEARSVCGGSHDERQEEER